jgi:metal iron transporter
MDLAQMNKAHRPRWLNTGLWIPAEASIICTDIGQLSIASSLRRGATNIT